MIGPLSSLALCISLLSLEAGASVSAQGRLEGVPKRVEELESRAVNSLPRQRDVIELASLEPWLTYYPNWRDGAKMARSEAWPRENDAPALRALLVSDQPALRALSAEALATLGQIEDIPRLARLLSDEAAAPPFLEYRPYAVAYLPGKKGDDLCPMLIWKRGRVRDSAARALDLLTGMDFRQRSFADWWKENAIAKDRLWFWRQRARRMLSAGTPRPDMLQQLREEIRRQPPETEAKMRLLLSESSDNPLGEIDRDQSLFQGPLALRVSDNRLLELFEGKGLWPDVVWDEEFETRLITRLCQTGSPLLRVENLRVLQERLSRTTGWIARSALISSIGALMGGDRGTEYLRTEAIHEKELFVREEVIRELIRRDLSGNSTFIEARFFADNDFSGSPDVKQAILQELGKPPLSPLKRDLLCRLVLDPRLGPFLTRPSKVMGDDMWRKYAIWSLNVHAGRELMSPSSEEEYALTKPDTSKKALTDFLAKVQDLKNGRQK